MSDEQAALQLVLANSHDSTNEGVDPMLKPHFTSNAGEAVLFRVHEALGALISTWRAQPSCGR